MANDLKIGDRVYVPCAAFDSLADSPTALYYTEVVHVERRSVKVKLPDGAFSALIGSSRVHRNVGVAVFEIGDFATEATLLDPLSKSVLQFLRLLIPDDQLRATKVRGKIELNKFWTLNHAAYSHVILIGHGAKDRMGFAADGEVLTQELVEAFNIGGATEKTFVSLSCKTGYKAFGGRFSRSPICKEFIAPMQSVHGALASQFCQTFFSSHFLHGMTVRVSFNQARRATTGAVSFRLWAKGKLHTDPKDA